MTATCNDARAEVIAGITVEHDGLARTYDLFIPDGFDGQLLPLVLDLHPFESTPSQHRNLYSPFDQLAVSEGFLVAFPGAIGGVWNSQMGSPGIDDVGFLAAVVSDVIDSHSVDTARIYATGFSQGGEMVNRLACDAADLFAAFSTIAGPIAVGTTGNCAPSRAAAIKSFRAVNDPVIPYNGGPIMGLGLDIDVLSAADTFGFWRNQNSCAGPVQRETLGADSFCDSDVNCTQDSEVSMCTVASTGEGLFGHVIYSNTDNLNLAELSWSFFQEFTVPGAVPAFEMNPGLNGNWWNGPERNGEGAQVEIAAAGGNSLVFVATVYSYDPGGNQIFLVAVGSVDGSSTSVDVIITDGGVWGDEFDPAQVNELQWGSGIFTANSCASISMSLNPNAQFQAMGYTDLEYELVRLTTPALDCPL